MIQELISTSYPRCLNNNAGFGIVAQTAGMAANVSLAVNALSGYTHVAPSGSGRNPVVSLHAIRQTGGMLRHIVSRIADCGNDYTGRSNRIAHHIIVEENDISSLPGGPAQLAGQNFFRPNWAGKPAELPPRTLSLPDVLPQRCTVWHRLTGDAGWGVALAEHAEKGLPISIIFTQEHRSEDVRLLIQEALSFLQPAVRWKITFSTYFQKSQETGGDKIQIKCFLADSEESLFARQSPETLVIDLQHQQGAAPEGIYAHSARGGMQGTSIPLATMPISLADSEQTVVVPGIFGLAESPSPPVEAKNTKKRPDYRTGRNSSISKKKPTTRNRNWFFYAGMLLVLVLAVSLPIFWKPIMQWFQTPEQPIMETKEGNQPVPTTENDKEPDNDSSDSPAQNDPESQESNLPQSPDTDESAEAKIEMERLKSLAQDYRNQIAILTKEKETLCSELSFANERIKNLEDKLRKSNEEKSLESVSLEQKK